MKNFALTIASVGLLAGVALAPAARADEWNKRTILTINESIQVPNKVLPPGTYVMKLLDSPSNRHIVQIFDKNEQHLETTVLAIPNYRLEPTGKTQFQFWETPPGQPKALRAWFYPGDNFGQEFAYPKSEAMQIAAAAHTRRSDDVCSERIRADDSAGGHGKRKGHGTRDAGADHAATNGAEYASSGDAGSGADAATDDSSADRLLRRLRPRRRRACRTRPAPILSWA